jgi:hypothetical protein
MGEDPSSSNYLQPTNEDVWKFISEIRAWLINPDKRGIPN